MKPLARNHDRLLPWESTAVFLKLFEAGYKFARTLFVGRFSTVFLENAGVAINSSPFIKASLLLPISPPLSATAL
jgi:hypothetical protein